MHAVAAPSGRAVVRIRQPFRQPSNLLSIIEGRKYLSKKTESTEQKNESKTKTAQSITNISEENLNELLKAMKIGFYKDFRKRGLLTDEQLEMLIAKQDKPVKESA